MQQNENYHCSKKKKNAFNKYNSEWYARPSGSSMVKDTCLDSRLCIMSFKKFSDKIKRIMNKTFLKY